MTDRQENGWSIHDHDARAAVAAIVPIHGNPFQPPSAVKPAPILQAPE